MSFKSVLATTLGQNLIYWWRFFIHHHQSNLIFLLCSCENFKNIFSNYKITKKSQNHMTRLGGHFGSLESDLQWFNFHTKIQQLKAMETNIIELNIQSLILGLELYKRSRRQIISYRSSDNQKKTIIISSQRDVFLSSI